MFEDLGKALMAREEWEKALDCFAKLQECEAVSCDQSWQRAFAFKLTF